MIPKFRAWDKVINQMFIPDSIHFDSKGMVDGIGSKETIFGIEDFELMQSTGLTDVIGKEIYEGDVLRVWIEDEYIPNRDSGGGIIDYDCESGFSQIGKVEFEGSSFDYSTVKTLSGKHEEMYLPIGWLSNYEVIGNVHEHPELLENV